MVDTRRAVPNEESRRTVRPKTGCQSVRKADDLYRSETDRRINRYYNGLAPPSVCLPCVYLMSSHVTRSPGPSPTVFHTGSDEILAVERPGNEATFMVVEKCELGHCMRVL